MPRRTRELPWWIEGGTQICTICLQRYALETEHRCVNCDVVMCFFCAVREHGREITCGDCCNLAASG
jgi:hypothetical protein